MTLDQRAQLIEVLRRYLWHVLDHSASTEIIDDALGLALDRLLAFRFPCPGCNGTGAVESDHLDYNNAPIPEPCPSCGGSGVVDSPRVALVRNVEESDFDPRWDELQNAVVELSAVSDQGGTET